MRKTIAICLGAALLAMPRTVAAQEAKAAEAEKPLGKRLLVRFQETRLRGEAATAIRSYSLVLHADADWASVFVGRMVTITVAKETPTTTFKNVGVEERVRAKTLPDGRYSLEASFEDASVLGEGGEGNARVTAGNAILRVVKAASYPLTLREGETVPFASAVDPVTGEVVKVDLTVTAAPPAKAAPQPGRADARLRAQLVLVRRQGETTLARRPYSVVLESGSQEGAEAFSGSQLPVQTVVQGGPAVALKDIGAGLRVSAPAHVADGRYRLKVRFSDGVLAAGKDAPRIRMFESDSQVLVQEGETITVASVVDPETGDVVEAELTLEGVR